MLIYRKTKASSISEKKQNVVLSFNSKILVPKQNLVFSSFGLLYIKNGTLKKQLEEAITEEAIKEQE